MLRSKTITTKVFPLLEGLPEKVIGDIKVKENDKAFLFEPPSYITDTESKYYCLACGQHGKTNDSVPVCPHCGNHNARPFRTESLSVCDALIYRYIHAVEDGYLFIREFKCNPVEDWENGITVEPQEKTRVCIKDGEMLVFASERRYNGGVTESYWKKKDDIYSWYRNEVHLICTAVANRDPVLSKVEQFLTQPMSKLFEELKLAVAGRESKEAGKFPNISFPSEEYLTEVVEPIWIAQSYDTPTGCADRFVHRHSWCTNCGQYHMKVVDKDRYYSSPESTCLNCGNSNYHRRRSHYLMDALETESGGALLRINCGQRKQEFAGPNVIGVDPTVNLKYETIFTNYVLITADGGVSFFNEEKQPIEQLQVPLLVRKREQEFFYTDEAKRIWNVIL